MRHINKILEWCKDHLSFCWHKWTVEHYVDDYGSAEVYKCSRCGSYNRDI